MKYLVFLALFFIMATCSPLYVNYEVISTNYKTHSKNGNINNYLDIYIKPLSVHYHSGDIALQMDFSAINYSEKSSRFWIDSIKVNSDNFNYFYRSTNEYISGVQDGLVTVNPKDSLKFSLLFYEKTFHGTFNDFKKKLRSERLTVYLPIVEPEKEEIIISFKPV